MLRFPDHVPPGLAPPPSSVEWSSRELPRLRPADEVVLCAGVHKGSPGILVLTRKRLLLVSMPQGEVQVLSYPFRRILAVEEHRSGTITEVLVVTANATIVLSNTAVSAAWTFCRHLRQAVVAAAKRS